MGRDRRDTDGGLEMCVRYLLPLRARPRGVV